ncbi:MAG: biotin-independent malonate decarboxylase subunit gamma [Azoarcus sp.]|nr:biotin-independent malonate decarboxylase subunit gamma [Azoarcus sp.]
MKRDEILKALFPAGWEPTALEHDYLEGRASVGGTMVTVIGTAERVEVGADLALRMAAAVLATVRNRPGEAILFLLDTQGQRLRRRDELLGLNGYMAHLAKCVEIARGRGHVILSVVYGEAVSGGYLTTGMMADACYALGDAEIKVMNLPALARITKLPLERVEVLAQRSPVFSPGVANYHRMGHLRAVWSDDHGQGLADTLADALAELRAMDVADRRIDGRIAAGAARGGRTMAAMVVERVRSDA